MRSGGGAICEGGKSPDFVDISGRPPEIQHERKGRRSLGNVSRLNVVIDRTNLSAKLREETRRTPKAYRTIHAQLRGP